MGNCGGGLICVAPTAVCGLNFTSRSRIAHVCTAAPGKGIGSRCALMKASPSAGGFQNAGLGVLGKPARFSLS